MTTPTETLNALLERIEKAEGPDRELDGELCRILLGWTYEKMKGDRVPYWRTPRNAGLYYMRESGPLPLTSSLDAALTLVERELPGWNPIIGRHRDAGDRGDRWRGTLIPPDARLGTFALWGATPALALLAALLRAKIGGAG